MTRLYDTFEPAVLNESLLLDAVREQGPRGEAGRVALEEGIAFEEVTELQLDFRNILHLENLWQFRSLVKLQVDNNIIEKISGLESLTHLEWLDLSFNNIEVIEGLSTLHKLRDLSLAHNRICRLDGMEGLHRLQVLSLGHNCLEDLEQVLYLRQFKQLASLNLSGNPFCSSSSSSSSSSSAVALVYPLYPLATLPQLVYMDFKFISPEARQEATEKYYETVELLMLKDRETERKMAADEEEQALLSTHKVAYVDGLQGSALFESMLAEDEEAEQIQMLPGVDELMEEFKLQVMDICKSLVEEGLCAAKKRCAEREMFAAAHCMAQEANKAAALAKIGSYESQKAELWRSVKEQPEGLQGCLDRLVAAQQALKEALMRLEMELVEQLDEIVKEFERQYSELAQAFQETVQARMTQCRELEGAHHEKVVAIATQLLERFSRNQLEEGECADQLRALLVDKDAFMGSISTSHDLHLLAIDNKEDTILQQLKKDTTDCVNQLAEEEVKRNRGRVLEIMRYIGNEQEDMETMEENYSTTEN